MNTIITCISIFLLLVAIHVQECHAQLPGKGNIDWQEVWTVTPPDISDTTNPHYWMRDQPYTGLAYDKINDVVYIVSPALIHDGIETIPSPRIYAWIANNGALATFIGDSSLSPPGQLSVNSSIVHGGFSDGQYSIFKIDLDDDGRIYAANVVAPVFGVCFPGPPPQCLPDYVHQGPYKVYRWDTHDTSPELLFQTTGSNQSNSGMTWTSWGTAFDVVGGLRNVDGALFDSTRIYTSGGNFFNGYFSSNDEINVIVKDTRHNAPTPFRLGVKLKHNNTGMAHAAHGIAATGPYKNSSIYLDSNSGDVYNGDQDQDTSAMPQLYSMSLSNPFPALVTGRSGPIKYVLDSCFQRPFLICAAGRPTDNGEPGQPNSATNIRVVDLKTGPNYRNWPPTPTPNIDTNRFDYLAYTDNGITDVDYKKWINPVSGDVHLQVFVLMSNNGIACYRTRYPFFCTWPVELSSFTATVAENTVHLAWTTATETNNYGFEIERNIGSTWQNIGFVEGHGTTTVQQEYVYEEPVTPLHEQAGSIRYRLKQIDYDGTSEYSPEVEVLISSVANGVALHQNYPNPFSGTTSISYTLPSEQSISLDLYDMLGRKVRVLYSGLQESGTHTVQFDAQDLPAAMYRAVLRGSAETQSRIVVVR